MQLRTEQLQGGRKNFSADIHTSGVAVAMRPGQGKKERKIILETRKGCLRIRYMSSPVTEGERGDPDDEISLD
ncbi:uncharacterized protein FFMR_08057 [Fusarium fujikuroi]|nr:uncharacterized protein FFMR_08057 [Fusarium fujikuroi]